MFAGKLEGVVNLERLRIGDEMKERVNKGRGISEGGGDMGRQGETGEWCLRLEISAEVIIEDTFDTRV
jgi:hypothetical protein